MAGTLFVIATPIGNLEDVTARAIRLLREVSVIAAEDTRHTAKLLARYGITTPTTSLHEHNEHQKTPEILDRLRRGENVALVSDAGTPAVSDPGSHLVERARQEGIAVSPIPGPSALTALLSVIGVPHEGFHFLGFPPTRSKDRQAWFDRLAGSWPLAVFYEAPHRIRATLAEVGRRQGLRTRVIVGRELTKTHEELVDGPIEAVITSTKAIGEYVVAVFIGQSTDVTVASGPSAEQIRVEFVHLTNNDGLTRRAAISSMARKYAMSAREVYAALEATKGSVG